MIGISTGKPQVSLLVRSFRSHDSSNARASDINGNTYSASVTASTTHLTCL